MKLAVSACLLGVPCRYDGRSKADDDLEALLQGHEVVKVCPEVMGGMKIPHPANEIQPLAEGPGRCRVVDKTGVDNTDAFYEGARKACEAACSAGCTHAILKAKSPSCGVGLVYDGSFTGTLVPGMGIAAQMMDEAGISVMTEKDAKKFLQNI